MSSHLSSNWLKLQKKSKNPNNKVIKKTRVKNHAKTTQSIIERVTKNLDKKQTADQPLKNSEQLAKWALENGVPIQDASETYNIPVPKTSCLTPDSNISEKKKTLGKYLAIDCEFVGVGPSGSESALARVSIVNFHGHVVYDHYVKPNEKVTDWRTWVSGIKPSHMNDAIDFKKAQKDVSDMLNNRILVGHAVDHDLEALLLSHPKLSTRDTSKFQSFRQLSKGKTPSLKKLAKEILNIDIQGGEHSSVEDARATMMLYKLHKKEFEKLHLAKYNTKHNK